MHSPRDAWALPRRALSSRQRPMHAAALVGLFAVAVAFGIRSDSPVAAEREATLKSGFVVPTAEHRFAAIGEIRSLPTLMQRAFQPGTDFTPMTTPQPGEWLAAACAAVHEALETPSPREPVVAAAGRGLEWSDAQPPTLVSCRRQARPGPAGRPPAEEQGATRSACWTPPRPGPAGASRRRPRRAAEPPDRRCRGPRP